MYNFVLYVDVTQLFSVWDTLEIPHSLLENIICPMTFVLENMIAVRHYQCGGVAMVWQLCEPKHFIHWKRLEKEDSTNQAC